MEEAGRYKRKFKFNTITPEDIITYNIAASMNDKKARDKFIKGPLKLQLILETIELDYCNRKYGDKQTKSKRQRKNSPESTSEDEHVRCSKPVPKKKATFSNKKKIPELNCSSTGKQTGRPNTLVLQGRL